MLYYNILIFIGVLLMIISTILLIRLVDNINNDDNRFNTKFIVAAILMTFGGLLTGIACGISFY